MSLILSIETATAIGSVALHHGGKLIAHRELITGCSHAEQLMVMIEQLLEGSDKKQTALEAIALSSGPGSYTGLRIGASIAKGLCYGLAIPLIAIPTLEAMLYGMLHAIPSFFPKEAFLCPVIDARRAAIYTLIADQKGTIKRATHVGILDNSFYQNSLPKQPLCFFGDGVQKCKKMLQGYDHIYFLEGGLPSAVQIGLPAFQKFSQSCWEDMASYEPYYLSQFQ